MGLVMACTTAVEKTMDGDTFMAIGRAWLFKRELNDTRLKKLLGSVLEEKIACDIKRMTRGM